jgi:hypothetical protein
MKLFIKMHGLKNLIMIYKEKSVYKISYFNTPVRLDIAVLKIVENYILFEKNTDQNIKKNENSKFVHSLLTEVIKKLMFIR